MQILGIGAALQLQVHVLVPGPRALSRGAEVPMRCPRVTASPTFTAIVARWQ